MAKIVWGDTIVVNGVYPKWLKPEDKFRWSGGDLTWENWDIWDSNDLISNYVNHIHWDKNVKEIRLPADHFAYKAIAHRMTPWGGGENPPEDFKEGYILSNGGEICYCDTGTEVSWEHRSFYLKCGCAVIGYSNTPAIEEVLITQEEYKRLKDIESKYIEILRIVGNV